MVATSSITSMPRVHILLLLLLLLLLLAPSLFISVPNSRVVLGAEAAFEEVEVGDDSDAFDKAAETVCEACHALHYIAKQRVGSKKKNVEAEIYASMDRVCDSMTNWLSFRFIPPVRTIRIFEGHVEWKRKYTHTHTHTHTHPRVYISDKRTEEEHGRRIPWTGPLLADAQRPCSVRAHCVTCALCRTRRRCRKRAAPSSKTCQASMTATRTRSRL